MTADVWAELGKIAGIGGISLGIVLVLFREVIRKKFFSKLTGPHSFIVVVLFLVLVWSIGIVGIGAWVYLSRNEISRALPGEVARASNYSQINCCSEWEIRGARINERLKGGMLQILDLFGQKRYQEASQELELLADSADIVQRFKADYRTAIYFAEGRFAEALESVLARYASLPLSDVRYRWDIAYVIYFFRREKGVAEAERVIAELKAKYRRLDLSYVWMGIQPKAHERLMQADLYPYQTLHDDQLAILRDVVQKYPDDAFVDHALYFLKDYDGVIRDHPDSFILDRAYYAKAYLAYHELTERPTLATDELINRIQADFEAFIQKFPTNNLTPSAYFHLISLQFLRADPRVAYKAMQDVVGKYHGIDQGMAEEGPDQVSRTRQLAESFLDSLDAKTIESIYQELASDAPASRLAVQRLVALAYFKERDYPKSWEYYEGLDRKLELGKRERARMAAISLAALQDAGTASNENALRIGLAFKDSISAADHAVPYFERYLALATNDEERARALLLQAFSYRNAGDADNMTRVLNELLARFPDSELADDALAEIGLRHLLWGFPDYQKAIDVFVAVVRRYPNGNAVDNSYNWIAYALMQAGSYGNARQMYQSIEREFPMTRFARYARLNIEALDERGL
jgi:TolA-binding protein